MNVSVAYSTNGFATAGSFILGSQATPVALNKVSSSGYSVLRLPLTGPALPSRRAAPFRSASTTP